MDVCTALLSMMIVGAIEYTPGIMHVEQLNTDTGEVTEMYVYTDDYLSCWENGIPVRPSATID